MPGVFWFICPIISRLFNSSIEMNDLYLRTRQLIEKEYISRIGLIGLILFALYFVSTIRRMLIVNKVGQAVQPLCLLPARRIYGLTRMTWPHGPCGLRTNNQLCTKDLLSLRCTMRRYDPSSYTRKKGQLVKFCRGCDKMRNCYFSIIDIISFFYI